MCLYDEKRQIINDEEKIEFTNIDTNNTFVAEVIKLHRFDDFRELYNYFPKEWLGYKEDEIANYTDMEKYYSKEEIKKYWVVAIQIKVIK